MEKEKAGEFEVVLRNKFKALFRLLIETVEEQWLSPLDRKRKQMKDQMSQTQDQEEKQNLLAHYWKMNRQL